MNNEDFRNFASLKDFGIEPLTDWEQIEHEKVYKYEKIEEMWKRKDLTTLDMMRHLAKVIDGKEPPTRKRMK